MHSVELNALEEDFVCAWIQTDGFWHRNLQRRPFLNLNASSGSPHFGNFPSPDFPRKEGMYFKCTSVELNALEEDFVCARIQTDGFWHRNLQRRPFLNLNASSGSPHFGNFPSPDFPRKEG
ncbi:hypothetical protein CDAR_524631 [Caerostris darwini]|uniref:Uncharacterized protein n=1 Tax=Caerostris darwini TaxID=1538125 RepID=A0AAV4PWW3_9ARAC|nr:hypothetical protein CDAR_524631 [Caerostris darwini]